MKYVNSSTVRLTLIVSVIAFFFHVGIATAAERVKKAKPQEAPEKNTKVMPANERGVASASDRKVVAESDEDAINIEYPLLDITGSFQFQYIKANGTPQINEMDIRRFNLSVLAQVNERVSLLLEPEYGKDMPAIRDAYATFDVSGTPVNLKNTGKYAGNMEIYAGNHRVPFSAEVLQNDINLRFVERNLTSVISPDRMVGLSVVRTMLDKKLIVQAGVWNSNINSKSEGTNLQNSRLGDNQIFATNTGSAASNIAIKAFRVGYSTAGRDNFYTRGKGFGEDENFKGEKSMAYGFSYYNSSAATTVASTASAVLNGASAYEADMLLRYGKLSAEIEYAKRNLDWWQLVLLPTSHSVAVSSAQASYTVQASYLVMENMSVALRKESFVYDGSGQVLKGAFGQDKDDWTTIGLNYYSHDLNTKIQGNYILKREDMPAGIDAPSNDTLLIQATTYF